MMPIDVHPDDYYWLNQPGPITAALESLRSRHNLVTLHLGPGKHAPSFVTIVLVVDLITKRLLLDLGRDPLLNITAMRTGELWLRGQVDGVRIDCPLETPKTTLFEGRSALLFRLPRRLRYQQRRAVERIRPPSDSPLWCELPLFRGGAWEWQRLQVADVSPQGVGFCPAPILSDFYPGRVVRSCAMKFPQQELDLTIEVVHIKHDLALAVSGPQIGCRFIGLSAQTQAALHLAMNSLTADRNLER